MKIKILAGIALIIGIIAVFIGTPEVKSSYEPSVTKLQNMTTKKLEAYDPIKLAEDIIEQNSSTRIVDLRTSEEYAENRIPGAINIPISNLHKGYFFEGDNIVLYSDDDLEAAKAWYKLRSQGINGIKILYGGYKSWDVYVLNPILSSDVKGKALEEALKRAQIAVYFGGDPRGIDVNKMQKSSSPSAAPAPTATTPAKSGKPNLGGGC